MIQKSILPRLMVGALVMLGFFACITMFVTETTSSAEGAEITSVSDADADNLAAEEPDDRKEGKGPLFNNGVSAWLIAALAGAGFAALAGFGALRLRMRS